MRKFIYFLIIVIHLGCNSNRTNPQNSTINRTTNDSIDFKSFSDFLDIKELPLSIECNFLPNLENKDFSNFIKFMPKDCEMAEKIKTDNSLNLILFKASTDTISPLLYSFNSKGDKLDSISLYLSSCAITTRIEHSALTIIQSDLSIIMVDTSNYFSYMKHGTEYIRNLDSTIISKKIVLTDKEGKFKIVDRDENN